MVHCCCRLMTGSYRCRFWLLLLPPALFFCLPGCSWSSSLLSSASSASCSPLQLFMCTSTVPDRFTGLRSALQLWHSMWQACLGGSRRVQGGLEALTVHGVLDDGLHLGGQHPNATLVGLQPIIAKLRHLLLLERHWHEILIVITVLQMAPMTSTLL